MSTTRPQKSGSNPPDESDRYDSIQGEFYYLDERPWFVLWDTSDTTDSVTRWIKIDRRVIEPIRR